MYLLPRSPARPNEAIALVAVRHESVVTGVERLLAEARLPEPGPDRGIQVGRGCRASADAGGLEDPPVRGRAVPLDVGAQQPDEFGRDRDRPCLVVGAVLQAPLLPRGAVIGPGRARAGGGGGQDDPPPPLLRQVQVARADVSQVPPQSW